MMDKTLGQIAHEAGEKVGGWARKWDMISSGQKHEWEAIASAVAAAVKEEDAAICDRFADREMHPAECAAAIRASIKP